MSKTSKGNKLRFIPKRIKRTTRPRIDPNAPLHQLQIIKLQNNWTNKLLKRDIERKTGHTRSEDCWRKIAEGITTPQDRTQWIIDAYLATFRRRAAR